MTTRSLNDFFFESPKEEKNYFDEGPKQITQENLVLSSSMDTSQIDQFRQGVEITNIKHFDAGIVKIHSAEPGHKLKNTTYGITSRYNDDSYFTDEGGNDPITYIGTEATDDYVVAYPFTSVPPIKLSSLELDRIIYNGVIDFLGSRERKKTFFSDAPRDNRGITATIMQGNADHDGGTDSIVNVYDFSEIDNTAFKDAPELLDDRWPTGNRVILDKSQVSPFADVRLLANYLTSSSYSNDMTSALSVLTGSASDNYVNSKQRSTTSGWDYIDGIGTDSIVFGETGY